MKRKSSHKKYTLNKGTSQCSEELYTEQKLIEKTKILMLLTKSVRFSFVYLSKM
jgi:hypothetical protein